MDRGGLFFLVVAALAGVGVLGYAVFQTGASRGDAPSSLAVVAPVDGLLPPVVDDSLTPLHTVPNYSMMDSQGAAFELSSMSGKVWAVDFFFTTCASQCPAMTTNMSHLSEAFKTNPRFECVSISVDPETDSHDRLADYAARFEADASRWHFLRSDRDVLMNIATNGLRLGTGTDPALHRSHFILVDQTMRVRGYYDGLDAERLTTMAADIDRLLNSDVIEGGY